MVMDENENEKYTKPCRCGERDMKLRDIWWHFKSNWTLYMIVVVILSATALVWYVGGKMAAVPRSSATVTVVAEGVITNVRATGAWENWCKIELKFEDGTVLLTSYRFIRQHKIRQGRRYVIKNHSRLGLLSVESP